MISFLKQVFIWWHRQTFGTFFYTLLMGKFVGKDEFNNKYYSNSKGKRWVVYNNIVESSKIPAEWHLWIHHIKDKIPSNVQKYAWQKKHEENLTGTKKSYKPEGSLIYRNKRNLKKYETWKN